jgi:hypothetical protein
MDKSFSNGNAPNADTGPGSDPRTLLQGLGVDNHWWLRP